MDVPYNKEITYIARTHFRNQEKIFGIKKKDRRQHMYVLGKSGTGKSALLYNMAIQDIANGEGVCVVDPHGELVEDILRAIPEDRLDDVIYFNPADTEYHIGFNVLELNDPRYKHLVASGLMSIFTKIWANTWSARMEYIMNNAILALLDTPGTTLLGIQRILVDKDYRQQIINNLKDPVVKTFWINEYEAWQEKFRNEAIAPIQNKVGQFLSTALIRNVVGQSKSTVDIFEIMNNKKIFLVNVSKGRIGEDNSALLGGMLITKIQLAAMERVRIPEPDRVDFYLYVDEFQNFVTDSFASILSEARKYRLNLIIAHQYIGQLKTEGGDTVREAVFGNVGTMLIFRVGAEDADFLEKEFTPEFTPEDIVAQPNYHVYLKLMVDGVTSRPFSSFTLPPMQIAAADDSKTKVIKNSRRLYTRKKEDIEKEINDWSGLMGTRDTKGSEGKWKANCSTCGKDIFVPFEPEEGRPVYCKDCMTKIKAGELKPIQKFKINPRKQIVANDELATLGIEFEQQGDAVTAALLEHASQKGKKRVKSTFKHPERKGPDKEDLGKVLAEALSFAGKTLPPQGEEKEIEKKEEPKKEETISLSSLKNDTAPVASMFSKKEQSDENKEELRKVLESAMVKDTTVGAAISEEDALLAQKKNQEEEKQREEEQKKEEQQKREQEEARKKAEDEQRQKDEERRRKEEEERERKEKEDREAKEWLEKQKAMRKEETPVAAAPEPPKQEEKKPESKPEPEPKPAEPAPKSPKKKKEVPEDLLRKIFE